jgi:hypothetical protein
MKDKKGKELQVGDDVKIFSYYKAKIIEIETTDFGEEIAVVETKTGTNVVYSDEIRKFGGNKK